MPWKFVRDDWFQEVFTNNNLQADNEMKRMNKKSKNTVKNRPSFSCYTNFPWVFVSVTFKHASLI